MVSWSGADDTGGSGIASYDVFVSDNDGPFAPFLLATADTSTTFNGLDGHTYGFFSVATDNVGHREATPTAAQTSTLIVTNRPPVADAGGPFTVPEGGSVVPDGSASTDPDQPSETLIYEWGLDGDSILGETGLNAARGDETGAKPTFSAAGLDGPGTFTVALRVTDNGDSPPQTRRPSTSPTWPPR